MEQSKPQKDSSKNRLWFGVILAAIPFIIGLSWGIHFPENIYSLLHTANSLTVEQGLDNDQVGELITEPSSAPLFSSLLSLVRNSSLDILIVTALISLCGWGIAIIAFLAVGFSLNCPQGAFISALLLAFNPFIIPTLGSAAPWVIASFWAATALILRRHYIFGLIAVFIFISLLIPWPIYWSWLQIKNFLPPFLWSIVLLIVGIGAQKFAHILTRRYVLNTNERQTTTLLLSISFLFFGSYQLWQLVQEYQYRPTAKWQAENEIASWLREESPPTALILASDKIGLLSDRNSISLTQLPAPLEDILIQPALQGRIPAYIVTDRSLPWEEMTHTPWFQLNYKLQVEIESPNLAEAPFSIWKYRVPLADLGQRFEMNARVPDRFRLIGYQLESEMPVPGQPLDMVLYLQAEEESIYPPEAFNAEIRLIGYGDGKLLTDWQAAIPQSLTPDQWEPGQVVGERLSLSLPDTLDVGAYQFNISFSGSDSEEFWPISLDNDINRLDRVPLGNIVLPQDVNMDGVNAQNINFGGIIDLIGSKIIEDPDQSSLEVSLFWQPEGLINQDYIVFVHVVDESGNLTANHDSQPAEGHFPTSVWPADLVVEDIHRVSLPSELPGGIYQIVVGLYLPESGERLSIIDGQNETAGDTLTLGQFSIP